MNRSRGWIHYLVLVLILASFAVGLHWDMKRTVDSALQEQEHVRMKAWKSRLFPLYEEMEVDYNKNPKTLIEVFDPLIKLFEI